MHIKKMLEKSRKETTRSSKMRTVADMLIRIRNASFGTNITTIINLESSLVPQVVKIIRDFGADRSIPGLQNFNAAEDGDKRIIEDLGADSLDSVELVQEFESQFNIRITDEKVAELTTFNLIFNYLTSLGFPK
jgi:acyl carrier protein